MRHLTSIISFHTEAALPHLRMWVRCNNESQELLVIMSLGLILAVGSIVIGILMLCLSFGLIKQKFKPEASKDQVAKLQMIQKFSGYIMIAMGAFHLLRALGVHK